MGDLKDGRRWQIQGRVVKDLLAGRKTVGDLTEEDVYYDLKQKGVDIVLDPLWSPISADLHEHIDGLQSVWKKPKM